MPWEVTPGQGEAFLGELTRELSPGHALYGRELVPLGHSRAADDALFEARGGQVIEVHLTWRGHAEQPPWPRHKVYGSLSEWIEQVMLPVHDEHRY